MRNVFWILGASAFVACSSDEFASSDAGDGSTADVVVERTTTADGTADGVANDAADVWAPPPPLDCNALKTAIVCSNFEESAFPAPPLLEAESPDGGAFVSLASTPSYSTSHSALAHILKPNGPVAGEIWYQFSDSNVKDRFVLRFAFRVEQRNTSDMIRLAAFTFASPSGTSQYYVGLSGTQEVVVGAKQQGGPASELQVGSYSAATWHHVVLDMHLVTSPSATATFDGASKVLAVNAGAASSGARTVFFGARSSTALTGDAKVYVDDIALDAP